MKKGIRQKGGGVPKNGQSSSLSFPSPPPHFYLTSFLGGEIASGNLKKWPPRPPHKYPHSLSQLLFLHHFIFRQVKKGGGGEGTKNSESVSLTPFFPPPLAKFQEIRKNVFSPSKKKSISFLKDFAHVTTKTKGVIKNHSSSN